MVKSDDIRNNANKHYLCRRVTEKCANNNDNANNETKMRKNETTKIVSMLRLLSLACILTREMNCDKRKTTKQIP